jgi:hypothetical protein
VARTAGARCGRDEDNRGSVRARNDGARPGRKRQGLGRDGSGSAGAIGARASAAEGVGARANATEGGRGSGEGSVWREHGAARHGKL